MSFLSNLTWRYATKKFDTTRKISPENLEKILEAIRLAPSSFGLQPYHFYVISNPELLGKIQIAAPDKLQISTASHLIVMYARNDLIQAKEEYFELMSGGNPDIRVKLAGFEQTLMTFMKSSSPEWAKKQVYIVLGFILAACAELQIDSCPMEGFDYALATEILTPPTNLDLAVMIPIGYRALDDVPRPKVRFPREKLFTFVS